jgi:5-methylcytosine-specific restriction enzyme A
VLLFTGEVGQRFGYHDRWLDADSFLYFGEGQYGDMVFTRGNRAVRDHAAEGRRLLLFEIVPEDNGLCRHLGEFRCADWAWLEAPDRTGRPRRAIAFTLRRQGGAS